ncbi:PGPGW domain-containing protein [Paraglaciecola polaris]|uniref:Integral membrane protein TerC n=1 Tax=Paraglaciecola polaris LMG 21857 TaxID=1129793 RepID=K6ZWR0_9ALTE|nr:PGPGW domain-containing protein [Paraglaciecola polaris]GAC34682.1 integral membrane protein TerC [Paraglaciecola polaris LMG 21857]
MKKLRIGFGAVLLLAGIVLFIIPGSMLLVLAGLLILSVDVPMARTWLKRCQNSMSRSSAKLDRMLLNRKLRD